jgi:alpha-N-arabinofuranosidase
MRQTCCTVAWLIVVLLPQVLPAASTLTPASNLLPNPSFEEGIDQPVGWSSQTWGGQGEFRRVDNGRTGSKCVMIQSDKGGDVSWAAKVEVEPNSTYRLSGWIRTEGLKPGSGRGAQLNVHELQGSARTAAVTGTTGWTRVETLVRTGDQRQITVNCLFGGWGQSTGQAWFDDVNLERINLAGLVPVVTLQMKHLGSPINPFIYGQFIEHLGRCIYGGIWAEMLEDRKFYFPITADYKPYRQLTDTRFPVVGASPWEIIGSAEAVTMVKKDPFVGKHTPQIRSGAGLRQRDLGVVEGKDYVGYIWLAAPESTASVDVTLVWGEKENARKIIHIDGIKRKYRKHPLRFASGAGMDKAMLEIRVTRGEVLIGTVSLMPADNVRGMRADTLTLLKQLGATMYRWPGGNFVSGYDWRDGIGDRDRRPPRKNPAWTGAEHNDFGLDEFIDFCREVGAEPVIAANTGFGDAYSAAQEVEYCNGSADTIGGSWRAKNGHSKPYGVKYWCVGNEMWGPWQLGFMQLSQYTLKHNQVAEAMWKVDPSIRLIGSGQLGTINREHDPGEKRDWSRAMLEQCADHMNYLSEHFYCGRNRDNLVAHVNQLADSIRQKVEGHRRLQGELGLLDKHPMPIAMDEWNYWHQPYVYGELGCAYDLSDALGVAVGLHEYFRNSDLIQMAHYAQTVNVIGCIKTTKTDAFFSTTALPLMLYRHQFGSIPIEVAGDHSMLSLDVAAAWTADRKAVTISVVNPNREPHKLEVKADGIALEAAGTSWIITGDEPSWNNEGGSEQVKIAEQPVRYDGSLQVAPLSVTLARFPVR